MDIKSSTTFDELIAEEECGDDKVLARVSGDPIVMNAVLDCVEEDVGFTLTKELKHFTPEYIDVLKRVVRIGFGIAHALSDEALNEGLRKALDRKYELQHLNQ